MTPQVVRIRWMRLEDLDRVVFIEQQTFALPWREQDFRDFLGQRISIGRVAVGAGETPLGYLLYEILPGESRIVRMAVAPECRRKGIGKMLVQFLCSSCRVSPNRRAIRVEVPERMLAAQCMFRSLDMRAVGVLHDFYKRPTEDAYRFVWHADAPEGLGMPDSAAMAKPSR